MKALVLEAYKKFVYQEVPTPQLKKAADVLIHVQATGICGSDVHGMDGSTGRRRPPVIMGHEAAGMVAEVGAGVTRYKPGDRVTFDSTIWCGECWYCRRGQVNLCDNRRVLGVSCEEYRCDGAFAEYVSVPQRILYPLPDAVDVIAAAVTEPLAVAAHAAAITPIAINDSLVVVGAGLIGLLLIQVLHAASAGKIFALDVDQRKLEMALRFGADAVFDATDPLTPQAIRDLTLGRGADRAFEAVGASAPIATALACVRKGGSVTLIGNVSPKIELPLQAVVTREITLFGSCAIAGEYAIALDFMARQKVDVRALISATPPLSEGAVWFKRLYDREPGLMKVVMQV